MRTPPMFIAGTIILGGLVAIKLATHISVGSFAEFRNLPTGQHGT